MANKTNKNDVYRALLVGTLLGFLAGILAIVLAITLNVSPTVQVSRTSNSLPAANTNAAFQENGNNSNASVATEGSAVGSAPSPAPPTSLSPAMESPQGDGAALRQPINANPGPGPDPAAARHSSSLP